jgi:GH15 family glucan-1,4-alpha-glucosidase
MLITSGTARRRNRERSLLDGYPPIAEHGLIGDLQSAALVSTDGTVNWFCCPRFDGPLHPGRDGGGAGLGQPRVPLQPEGLPGRAPGRRGQFSICTFWYVDALARSGRLEQTRLTLEKMFTYADHVGLYAEEIGLTGEQLGNFPQAFTHLALIDAAVNLDHQLDHGAGRDPVQLPPAPTSTDRRITSDR